ncbi:MAG: SDR family oxidoreductase [Pseudobdellovibrionaceae bacterium]
MITDKVAIVTGGTRGIGRAISLQLGHLGYHVFALYSRDRTSASELEKISQEQKLKIECLRGDLTHPEKFLTLVNEIKSKTDHVNVLVHSAASGVHRKAMDLSLKHMTWTFDINVFAIHQLIQSLVEMIPPGGRIVGVTSSGGVRVIPYYAAVGASKGALESLFRHYAFELAPKGITVNCICPGLVLTDAVEAFPDKETRLDKTIEATPSGRLTNPDDVSKVVAFLCSEAASQIIGQTIVVDGGKTLSS